MHSSLLHRRKFTALALLGLLPLAHAAGIDCPSRAITLVVPYPTGGNGDNIARVFAKKLGDLWARLCWWTTNTAPLPRPVQPALD